MTNLPNEPACRQAGSAVTEMKNTKERERRKMFSKIWNSIGFKRFMGSIPVAFIFMAIAYFKCEILFWIYMAVMGISSLIVRWYGHGDYREKPSKFLDIVEEVFWLTTVAMFLVIGFNYFFYE